MFPWMCNVIIYPAVLAWKLLNQVFPFGLVNQTLKVHILMIQNEWLLT